MPLRDTFNLMVERSAELDRTYGALAHPTRRSMLELLRLESLRVTELAAPFDVSLEAVSKHIRVLEAAGLLSRRIQGRDHILSLDAEPLLPAAEWIETYRSFWEGRLRALESYLKERK
jgi:DNA-binding transcriptional ArsR family regulator